MIKLKLSTKDIDILERLFDNYNTVVDITKQYSKLPKNEFMYKLKEIPIDIPKYLHKSIYEQLTQPIPRDGINITNNCKLYKKTVNIRKIGYFEIEPITLETRPIHTYYLRHKDDDYWIDVTYITKTTDPNMIGLDVGSERTFITNEGHVIKHVGTKKPMYEYIKTKKPKYLTIMENNRNDIVDAVCDYYATRYDSIAIEDLRTKDTTFNITATMFKHKSSRVIDQAIQRQSWHLLFNKLENRDDIKVYRVPPEYTSQICSSCGTLDKSSRNKTMWKCKTCGYEGDADINAANNIKDRGIIIKQGGSIDVAEYRKLSRKKKYWKR